MSTYSDSGMNVEVVDFVLQDDPASILINLRVKSKKFFSKITYHSIPSWQCIWDRCADEKMRKLLLGTLIAWDCMRFLSLGGEELVLCEGVALNEDIKRLWRYCFLNQFGEWRYLNRFEYRTSEFPRVKAKDEVLGLISEEKYRRGERHIITNGGGKDTLVGMMLMNDAHIFYDVYEGYLPIGGSLGLQRSLLERLRNAMVTWNSNLVQVTVEDNFYNVSDDELSALGITVKYYKTDFAVGHTANYPGYFPLILYHGYTHVWFNIEASSDRSMAVWNGESINHQWCKTKEYQEKSTILYRNLTGDVFFEGFFSTLRGLYDTHIYAIAGTEEHLLKKTHSCNYKKPWCNRCPKCCFSYLMLASFKGEQYAMDMVGSNVSLFDIPENVEHFENLLDASKVAWECVASHEECLLALIRCEQKGIKKNIILKFLDAAKSLSAAVKDTYLSLDTERIPEKLKEVTLERISEYERNNNFNYD